MIEPSTLRHHQRKLNEIVRLACEDVESAGLHSTADPEAFAQVVEMLTAAVASLTDACETLRSRDGYSWADIARPLGVTRSAAQQRFGKKSS